MGKNVYDLLMGVEPEELAKLSEKKMEIPRLSVLFGAPFEINVRAIPGERYFELSAGMMKDSGGVDLTKAYDINALIACEGMVEPDLKDRELQKHFGCATPKDLIKKMFNGGELTKIADTITELSGYGGEPEKEIKN